MLESAGTCAARHKTKTVNPTTIPAHTGSVSDAAKGHETMMMAATQAQNAPKTLQMMVLFNPAVFAPD